MEAADEKLSCLQVLAGVADALLLLLLLLVLQLVEPVVVAAAGDQLVVGAFFDHAALVQHDDAVDVRGWWRGGGR